MSSLEDRSFELCNINYFSSAFPLSHQGVLLMQIVNYEEDLKTLASPPQEIDPGQPKTVYTFNHMFKNEKVCPNFDTYISISISIILVLV